MAPSTLRDAVLKAAVDHVAEHGPEGLSFRQVAAAAGVSHQAPYHHFTDRRGIFRAIAIDGFTMFAEALRASRSRVDVDPTVALLQAYVDFGVEHRGHFRVMFRSDLTNMAECPERFAVADESFDVLLDHVQEVLGPTASVDEIRARALAMWSLAHGLVSLLNDGPLEQKLGAVVDRHAMVNAVAEQSGMVSNRKEP